MLRRILLAVLALVGLLVVVGVTGFLLLGRFELGPMAARMASERLGRPVTVARLHVSPGRWVTVELDGFTLANIEGGTRPLMLSLGHLSAELDPLSLLWGPPTLRNVAADKLDLLFERRASDGRRNWRFGPNPDRPSSPPGDDRSGFPGFVAATMRDVVIGVGTSSGQVLTTRLAEASVSLPGGTGPLRIEGKGSYNGVPASLAGDGGTLAAFRDAATPFPITLHLASDPATLVFKGTMTHPLDVDGARGDVTLDAPSLAPVLKMVGADGGKDIAAHLSGTLLRDGDDWTFQKLAGKLLDAGVKTATIHVKEGGRGEPDDIHFDIALDLLDLDALLARAGGSGGGSDSDVPLAVDPHPGALLDGTLAADRLRYRGTDAKDARVVVKLTPGVLAIPELSMVYLGARVQASGHIEPAPAGGRVVADLSLAGADLIPFARMLDFGALPIAGRLDAAAAARAEAATLNGAVRAAQVQAVASMTVGSISRDVMEMASTDLRRLLRKPTGTTPVSCMLAVLDMKALRGVVSPMRIRAGEGTIVGTGQFDLGRHWMDVTVGTEASTTGGFALDIPMRISGGFGSPSVAPARWSPEGRAALNHTTSMRDFPPNLRELAARNPCSR